MAENTTGVINPHGNSGADPENGKKNTAKSGAKAFIKNATSDDDLKFVEELIEKKWNGDEIK